jgi:5-methylcytosine-specific restriction endonuclease McrA
MYPTDIWCKLFCIKDNQTCIFENACGNRRMFLRSFRRKQVQSMRRHVKRNGNYNDKEQSYIPYSELIDLAKIYLRVGFVCWYCGKKMEVGIRNAPASCTIDHRKPISRGGSNSLDNIVLCCEECNIKKGKGDYA